MSEPLKVVDAAKPTPFKPSSGLMVRSQLEESERQLNEWLGLERQAKAEIARWTEVINRLKLVVDLLEKPAQVVKTDHDGAGTHPSGRIHWAAQWPELIRDLARQLARQPSRTAVVKAAVAKLGVTETNAYQSLRTAIDGGRLTLQWDCVWLPGTAPAEPPAWLKL